MSHGLYKQLLHTHSPSTSCLQGLNSCIVRYPNCPAMSRGGPSPSVVICEQVGPLGFQPFAWKGRRQRSASASPFCVPREGLYATAFRVIYDWASARADLRDQIHQQNDHGTSLQHNRMYLVRWQSPSSRQLGLRGSRSDK